MAVNLNGGYPYGSIPNPYLNSGNIPNPNLQLANPPKKSLDKGACILWTASAGAAGFGGAYFFGPKPVQDGKLITEGLQVLQDPSVAKNILKAGNDTKADLYKQLGATEEQVARYLQGGRPTNALAIAKRQDKIAEQIASALKGARGNGEFNPDAINEVLKKYGLNEITTEKQYKALFNKDGALKRSSQVKTLLSASAKKEIELEVVQINGKAIKAAQEQAAKTDIVAAKAKLAQLQRAEESVKKFYSQYKTKAALEKMLKEKFKEKFKDLPQADRDAKIKEMVDMFFVKGKKSKVKLTDLTGKIKTQKGIVEKLETSLQGTFTSQYDKTRGVLKEGASNELKTFFKNFKWKSAAKWGAIAAGAGLVAALIFARKSD